MIRPRPGTWEWRQRKALEQREQESLGRLLEAVRCDHGALPGRCPVCDRIDPDQIPF